MLLDAVTLPLEAAFNAWLKLDEKTHGHARQRLQALQGKLIHLRITNPGFDLYFLPTAEQVRISASYDAQPDVSIQGSALAFMRLAQAEDNGKAMLENGIKLDGDLGLGTEFSKILREIDVDWEELLSQAVGDTVAHQAGQMARNTKGWLDQSAQAMRLNTQEYLQEEARLLPAEAELNYYYEQIDQLRMDADRLEARLNRLVKEKDA
ncbi:SCP2 sterol-binding domain-containing protein [uncultured Thiothrix sp.]|uniref:ubiquinone biosynthesis accessory factor UbiJ n=1 Tax=uncultured Thiothrix sp. TaxID=223185 RepID=UPI0026030BC7|nr:SCP2 sterol-binding domain-containing protein [uncultured Thiothrix sp.]